MKPLEEFDCCNAVLKDIGEMREIENEFLRQHRREVKNKEGIEEGLPDSNPVISFEGEEYKSSLAEKTQQEAKNMAHMVAVKCFQDAVFRLKEEETGLTKEELIAILDESKKIPFKERTIWDYLSVEKGNFNQAKWDTIKKQAGPVRDFENEKKLLADKRSKRDEWEKELLAWQEAQYKAQFPGGEENV